MSVTLVTTECAQGSRCTWDVHALHELLRPPLDLLELVRQAALGCLHVAFLRQERKQMAFSPLLYAPDGRNAPVYRHITLPELLLHGATRASKISHSAGQTRC